MPESSVVEYIMKLMRSCPYIDSKNPLYLDFIGKDKGNFSIFPLAGSIVVEEYLSGSRVEEYPFAIASRFGTIDERARRENSAFTEQVEAWMRQLTRNEEFPAMGQGRRAQSLEVLGRGVIMQQDDNLHRGEYQIQCRLVYYVKE